MSSSHHELSTCIYLLTICACRYWDLTLATILCLTAPPLILENILKFTKKVRNLRNLCDGLDIRYHKITEIVRLNYHIRKATDDNYLEAVIIAFLRGEGGYQPTWRAVIHALLYKSNGPYLARTQ